LALATVVYSIYATNTLYIDLSLSLSSTLALCALM